MTMNDVVFVMAYSKMSKNLGKQLAIISRIFLWMKIDDHNPDLDVQIRDHLVHVRE
jgi:hypothetical protein